MCCNIKCLFKYIYSKAFFNSFTGTQLLSLEVLTKPMFTVKRKIHINVHQHTTVHQKGSDVLLHLHFAIFYYIYICYINLLLKMLQNNHVPLLVFVREYCIKCLSPDHQTAMAFGCPVVRNNTQIS